jgi:hypothetical protein
MSIFIYHKIPEEKLRLSAVGKTNMVEQWFKNHPKKRVCHAELWYGSVTTLKRKDFKNQIGEEVERILKEGRTSCSK